MQRIAVVSDSTADLPRGLVQQWGIHVMPQTLILGDKTWLDGVEIDPPTFYELLRTSAKFPSTSQPTVGAFDEMFRRVSQGVEGIVAVHISNELSGTLNSARVAAANLPDIPIEIIDARAASMQLGFVALAAARAAASGADLAAVAQAARDLVGRVHVYFVVDTLEYLHRGGRIGGAARLFGTALNLKPVLEIHDGVVAPVAKIRTRRKALDRVLELVAEKHVPSRALHASVLHVAAPAEAAEFSREIEARFHPVELLTAECGPVVGAHAGPGTVGVVFYQE